jgi:hypothetical protein
VPVEVEGPEGDDGEHLDFPELDRRAAQDVVYHGYYLRSSFLALLYVFGPPRCCPYSVVLFRRHGCSALAILHTQNTA